MTTSGKKEKLKTISLKLTPAELEELNSHAEASSLTKSEYIRQALNFAYGKPIPKVNQHKLASALKKMIDIKQYMYDNNVPVGVREEIEGRMMRVWDLSL